MREEAIQKLTDAIFERDRGRVLPIDLSVCEEYGMRGLCGNGCPKYKSKEECTDESEKEEV
jgi:hypothetical protein